MFLLYYGILTGAGNGFFLQSALHKTSPVGKYAPLKK